jgi:pilus assembly protein CpaE
VRLLKGTDDPDEFQGDIRRLHPSAAIVALGAMPEPPLRLVEKLTAEQQRTAIICASHDASPDLILRSIRAGAREFLRLPIISDELETVLVRTAAFCKKQEIEDTRKLGRMIAVFSSKGGCGASFIATNVASALQDPTALVDLNLQTGDLDLFLGVEARFSIVDVVQNRSRIDDALLKTYLIPHSTRLSLLASPHDAGASESIEPEDILGVMNLLRERFDYVVADLEHSFDAHTLTALDHSDEILLVLTLDIPSIRSAQRTLAIFDRLGYPRKKLHVIVNRMSKQAELDLGQVRRFLGEDALSVVQNDFKAVVNSINLGKPIVEFQPNSPVAGDIKRIASEIRGAGTLSDTELRKGLLGSLFRRQADTGGSLSLRVTSEKA